MLTPSETIPHYVKKQCKQVYKHKLVIQTPLIYLQTFSKKQFLITKMFVHYLCISYLFPILALSLPFFSFWFSFIFLFQLFKVQA